jgi:hypothetical protein
LIAQAYQVTYDSLIAVLAGTADALEPAAPPEPPVRLPPMAAPSRVAADFGRFIQIERRLRELAGQGIKDPSGAQVFPDAPEDALAWDGIGARMDIDDRAWLIADLQRRADGRATAPDAGVNGRLRSRIRNARAPELGVTLAGSRSVTQVWSLLEGLSHPETPAPARAWPGSGEDDGMADPAQGSADSPAEPAWGDARRLVMMYAEVCASAAVMVALHGPHAAHAVMALRQATDALRDIGAQWRYPALDEAVVEVERSRAAREALAAAGVVPPGTRHLRAL